MKRALIGATLMVCLPMATAASERDDKLQVLQLVKTYSETMACDTTFEGGKPLSAQLGKVFTIERDPDSGMASYYVLWGGDKGCAGGSGTSSYFVSEVGRFSSARPLLVLSDDAFGKGFEAINPRFIRSIQQHSPGSFTVVSLEHADQDGNNFPSKKYQYELRQQKGKWVMTKRSYLGAP